MLVQRRDHLGQWSILASIFEADQEEANTRLVLHCIPANNHETVVVSARDTDVLLLLVAHSSSSPSPNV